MAAVKITLITGYNKPGRYRPACLITHTGTRLVFSPRATRKIKSLLSGGNS